MNKNNKLEHGISKRFYAACAAMQGILANPKVELLGKDVITITLIKSSYKLADELLKQEAEYNNKE